MNVLKMIELLATLAAQHGKEIPVRVVDKSDSVFDIDLVEHNTDTDGDGPEIAITLGKRVG